MSFTKEILLRARIVFLAAIFFIILIAWKIVHLQFIEVDRWRNCAKIAQLEYRPIVASRGNIYAHDGALLATSLNFYSVALDPVVASDEVFKKGIDPLSQALSDFYKDNPPAYYKKRIVDARAKKRRYLLLHKGHVTYEEKKKMSRWPIFNQGKFKGGVIFEAQYKRYNPFKELARRTIGIHRARHASGLEYSFNETLKGVDGKALYQKVVGGNWKKVPESSMFPLVHGSDLVTTLDINLQDVAQSSLLTVLEKTDAQNGCAIVMEVATGAIKAMANLARTESGKYIESYNYAIGNQGTVEPGSIFKLASMLALLEETGWPLTEPIDTGHGAIQFYNRWMKDVKKGGYGLLTLQEVFEKSSNVGISMAIQQTFGANPQKFIDYIEQLGIHQPLGIELAGEGKPYMITPKSKMWSGVALPWLSIGYNLQITPLQLLVLYNAVANNGKMVKPFFVQQIQSPNGIVQTFPTTVLKEKICSDETLRKLKVMLEGTVERGLAWRIKHGFYKIAGKTGTAQKLVDGKYTDHHLTSFAGYFPADHPRYSCIIVVDSPQGEAFRFGAEVPAPIFKDIVDRIAGKDLQARKPINGSVNTHPIALSNIGNAGELAFLYQSLQLPIPENLNAKESWGSLKTSLEGGTFQPYTPQASKEVPSVLHMKLRDALFLLENNGLNVTVEGNIHGVVSKQSKVTANQITILLK
ncbi:MAG: penicillin-binding transpeptidase domain-containing protein [Candidatus Cardinium sp.]|uniref:penicillin-binding transpeptidase domain-containing protein n=1 Tax=Cardinium endosymbiont of Dermatophagoides farinae TaxID=2597823 RepID=UPI0011840140|nr:penicillin-binding transpeptidase domain-containing protein [Cardinium endosymbiont of Dermatophagoides farinae]TSJ81391.1 cell division protein [Cardinium endosymbiont of Dermatophagoides farinae]UWW97456.1 MAG: penicillin-binding transpeptidase domain-containing protein [Candidatus Cardinium sp.]